MNAIYSASVTAGQEIGSPERKHPRRSAQLQVRGVSVQDGFTATTHDISEEGMAFQSDLQFARGDRIQVLLAMPHTNESLRILCEVKHSHTYGLTGVEFVQLSQVERGRVLQMMSPSESNNNTKTGT